MDWNDKACTDKCRDRYYDYEKELNLKGAAYCGVDFDSTICWPPTLANETAVVVCPEGNPLIDTSKTAFQKCNINATWNKIPGYILQCFYDDNKEVVTHKQTDEELAAKEQFLNDVAGISRFVELFFICLSLFSLIVALFVLNYFSALKCHRTRIHKHLFCALIIFEVILTITVVEELISFYKPDQCSIIKDDTIAATPILCETLIVVREYSRFVVFAWMFIEGHYLNGLVSAAVFGTPKFVLYYIFGWMSPLPFLVLWIIFMSKSVLQCWYDYASSKYYLLVEIPRLSLLGINIVLLFNIIRVLVTKLRQNNSGESQLVRKAIKATAVLTPLLGVCNLTYLITPNSEAHEQSKVQIVFNHCIIKLPPAIQGFIVALLYCFLNGEVLAILRRRWSSWRLHRISGNTVRRTSASVFTTLTDDTEATGARRASARQTYFTYAQNKKTPPSPPRPKSDLWPIF
ncbi:PDF receptor-like isoform X3 [Antedon mediterranea]|uniref:PDF receptor-like isoform X3 n=1 Tax=Antedon mediterranea TaxID=105859 RepID=UPI003AF6ACCC